MAPASGSARRSEFRRARFRGSVGGAGDRVRLVPSPGVAPGAGAGGREVSCSGIIAACPCQAVEKVPRAPTRREAPPGRVLPPRKSGRNGSRKRFGPPPGGEKRPASARTTGFPISSRTDSHAGRLVHRLILVGAAALLAGCGGAPEEAPAAPTEAEILAEAERIHEAVLTLDTHIDIPFDYATEGVDPGNRNEDYQVDYPRMIEGGLDAGFFIVYFGQTERTPENYGAAKAGAMTKFDAIHRAVSNHAEVIGLADTADEVESIHASGKLVALIGIENGFVIGEDLSLLETYRELGARYITLTHNGHNAIGDSCNPRADLGDAEVEHGGLSEFGREVIAEMNRLGILVDVSHTSKDTMMQAAELSRTPLIASHSSAKALADVTRNMDDEQLRALAANGGVMQTVALRGFVKTDPPEKTAAEEAAMAEFGISSRSEFASLGEDEAAALRARFAEISGRFPVTVADFVDHIDHAVSVMGLDHVGISSDFDGGGGVDGWDDASETLAVTVELVRRGYTEAQIEQLWSGNTLRILREAERVAAEMQSAGS